MKNEPGRKPSTAAGLPIRIRNKLTATSVVNTNKSLTDTCQRFIWYCADPRYALGQLQILQNVVVHPALVGVERVVAGGGEPLLGRRLELGGGGGRSLVVSGLGMPAFIASRSLASMARSTTAFRSAPENWSVFLARCDVVDVLHRLAAAEDAQDRGPRRRRRAAARRGCGRSGRAGGRRSRGATGALVAARISSAVVARLDAVHLGQELVDQVPAGAVLHVAAAGAEGIDLVEEQHAGLVARGPARTARAGSARCCRSTCRARR